MKSEKFKPPPSREVTAKTYDSCPHCGAALSPWEQVLLSVDRALMCKRCWYRILLDVSDKGPTKERKP